MLRIGKPVSKERLTKKSCEYLSWNISFAISLAFSLVTGLPCAEHTLLAQQAYFHPRGKLAMPNGFSVYYRGRHLKGMSQNFINSWKIINNEIASQSAQQFQWYIFRIVSVSFPYRFRIVSVSFPYCFRIVSVSFSYCSPIVLLLFSYCSPIGKRKQYGNNTETIRNRTNEERWNKGG